jgi:glutamyl-tRNA reductase
MTTSESLQFEKISTHKNRRFFCWTWSVRNGDSAEIREELSLRNLESAQKLYLENSSGESYLYLQTCHRVELYGWGDKPMNSFDLFWPDKTSHKNSSKLLLGDDAYRHLVRMISSLESEVLGETQVTSQVKEAFAKNMECGWLKFPLNKIIEKGLASAKSIRTKTGIGEGTVSVAHAAIEGLSDLFETYENKKVLVVGAGSMAVQGIDKFRALGVNHIYWVNRSRDRIVNHSYSQFPEIQVQNFEDRYFLVPFMDIVFVATGSPQYVFEKEGFLNPPTCPMQRHAQVQVPSSTGFDLVQHKARSMRVFLDLGLPRNVDPEIHGLKGTFVRNVDEFRHQSDITKEQRKQKAQEAARIVELEIEDFNKQLVSWLKNKEYTELFQAVEAIRESELAPFKGTQNFEKIDYALRSICGKLMHRLKREIESLDEASAEQVIETLLKAWRQPEQWLQKKQAPLQSDLKNLSPNQQLLENL